MNKSLVERGEEKEVHCEAGRERFKLHGNAVGGAAGLWSISPVTTVVNSSLDRS